VLRTDGKFERMVIAVDPHKASWTAAAVSGSLQPVATLWVRSVRQVTGSGGVWLSGGRRRVGRSRVPVGWVPR
jgi:hypothetical protein